MTLKNFINGQFVEAHSTGEIPLISPMSEEVIGHAPISTQADVDAAFAAAAQAFQTWKRTTPGERQRMLLAYADAIEAHADELVQAQHRNTGQPCDLIASEEVAVGASQMRFFAGAARVLNGLSQGEYMEGMTSSIRREPIGVVAQVAPWNYPFMMGIWKIAPALAAGNTVVLKPSDTTPESTLVLAKISQGILPDGVLNVILGDASTGELMTRHRTPALCSITGSVRAGIGVASACAPGLKRPHLELGGKAPVVVFDDADIPAAAEAIGTTGYFNAGQDCTAACRVLVHESVAEEFTRELVKFAQNVSVGSEDGCLYGPLNNSRHLAKVEAMIGALPEYARIETGGARYDRPGYYFQPTVVTGLKQNDQMIQEEVFGPVITVQTFSDDDEALEMANGVDYGLASSVWTENLRRAERFERELDFGCVWVNTHIPLVAEMPHGGFKQSGYGKDLSMYGFEDYTRIKHVMSAH